MSHVGRNKVSVMLLSTLVLPCVSQTARCVGEWEWQTAAEDQGGSSVQASHRHSCAPGPQHLQVFIEVSVCLCIVLYMLLLGVSNDTGRNHVSSFLPQDVLLSISRGSPLSLPANPNKRGTLSPFLFVPLLLSSLPSPRGCWEFSDVFVMAVWGHQCFLH